MDPIVVSKLDNRDPVIPIVLPLVHKEVKELLNLLVNLFGLAVSLQVLSGGGGKFNPKDYTESTYEVGYKLGAPVTNHLFVDLHTNHHHRACK